MSAVGDDPLPHEASAWVATGDDLTVARRLWHSSLPEVFTVTKMSWSIWNRSSRRLRRPENRCVGCVRRGGDLSVA